MHYYKSILDNATNALTRFLMTICNY